jgi:NADH-quinone oxidoreductase subunit C
VSALLDTLKQEFGEAIVSMHSECGDDTVVVARHRLVEIARHLKEAPDMDFAMPLDVTAVDYLEYRDPKPCPTRFEVVYHLRSLTHKRHLRLKVQVAEDDPRVDSLYSVWRGVGWFERETFDMFGITFENHPDLRRILLYPEFEGHPLRKDYPVRGYQPTMPMPTLDGPPPGLPRKAREEE